MADFERRPITIKSRAAVSRRFELVGYACRLLIRRIKMGYKFEVYVFTDGGILNGVYAYEEYWRGKSWIKAIWFLAKAHGEGYGCVKLELR